MAAVRKNYLLVLLILFISVSTAIPSNRTNSSSATLTYNANTGGRRTGTVTSNQAEGVYYTITPSINDSTWGSISPRIVQLVDSTDTIKFTATANTGYKFKYFLIDNSRTDTTNPFVFTYSDTSHTIQAVFARPQIVIYDIPNDARMGSMAPVGITANDSLLVDIGSNIQFMASPNAGCVFDYFLIDNTTKILDNPCTIVNIDSTIKIIKAVFKYASYNITTSVSGSGTGSIIPSSTVTVIHGQDTMFTAAPNPGNYFDHWLIDTTIVSGASNPYILRDVTSAHSVTAVFNNTYNVSVRLNIPTLIDSANTKMVKPLKQHIRYISSSSTIAIVNVQDTTIVNTSGAPPTLELSTTILDTANYKFAGWTSEGQTLSNDATTTIQLSQNMSISANIVSASTQDDFAEKNEFKLFSINSANLEDRGSAFFNGSFIDGAVNISDFAGNLTLGHSMDLNFPNELKTKLTLTYDANASHAYFNGNFNFYRAVEVSDPVLMSGTGETEVNAPAWIFGLNGIAIQTTNFEKNVLLGTTGRDELNNLDDMYMEQTTSSLDTPLTGTSIPLLTIGYSYSNDIAWNGLHFPIWYSLSTHQAWMYYTGGSWGRFHDRIRILRADGSVITLYNRKGINVALEEKDIWDGFIGTYFDQNSNGYAVVNWAKKAGSTADDVMGTREVYYKPGDGLTYYFLDELAEYENQGTNSNMTINQNHPNDPNYKMNFWLSCIAMPPRICYLQEVRSPNGDKLKLNYASSNIFGTNVTSGRKFFTGVTYCDVSGTESDTARLTFNYIKSTNSNGTGSYQIDLNNSLSSESYSVYLNNYNPHNDIDGFNNIIRDNVISYSNIMQVSKIINTSNYNSFNKYVTYYYNEPFSGEFIRKYDYCYSYLMSESWGFGWYYFLNYPVKLLTKRIVNGGEKNTFTYWGETINDSPGKELNNSTIFGHSYNLPTEPSNFQFPEYTDGYIYGYYINAHNLNPGVNWWNDNFNNLYSDYFKSFNVNNMKYAARDNYSQSMIKTETTSLANETNGFQDISEKDYSYSWDGTIDLDQLVNDTSFTTGTSQTYDETTACIHNILTTIKTKNLYQKDNLSAKDYVEKKYFDYVRTCPNKFIDVLGSEYLELRQLSSDIRMTRDKIFTADDTSHAIQDVAYSYNMGTGSEKVMTKEPRTYYYYFKKHNSDYELKSKDISYNGVGKVKINYTYNNDKTFDLEGSPNNIIETDEVKLYFPINTVQTTIDQATKKSIQKTTLFDNEFMPTDTNSWSNPNLFYHPSINLEKIIDGTADITANNLYWKRGSRKEYKYYSPGDPLAGKIQYEITHDAINYLSTTSQYEYNTSGSVTGYLMDVKNDNGLTTTFKYNSQINTASGILVFSNQAYSPAFASTLWNNFQPEPFITMKSCPAVSDTTYSAFDGKGNLTFSRDVNGYYSSKTYDALGRVVNIYQPGSYDYSSYSNSTAGTFVANPVGNPVINYIYTDNLWVPDVTKNTYKDNSGSNPVKTRSYFKPSELSYYNSAFDDDVEQNKSIEALNYLGKTFSKKDGRSRTTNYFYDNYLNLHTTQFIDNLSNPVQTQTVEYSDNDSNNNSNVPAHFKKITLTDEENKVQVNYYDVFGNILANIKKGSSNGDTDLITTYTYDVLNRLISVKSPGGKFTNYEYDDWGNIKKRETPDDGKCLYRFDKWGNLRFWVFVNSENKLVFTTYDALNRPTTTGIYMNFSADSITWNPEVINTTFETVVANQTVINAYDTFPTTGVFAGLNYQPDKHNNLIGRLAATAYRDKPGDPWKYKFYSYDALGRVEKLYLKE
jgi:YD repeat-containing protein